MMVESQETQCTYVHIYFLFLFQAQTLASLKAWCQWLAQLHTASLKDESYEPQCRDLTSRIMVAVAPVVKAGDSPDLTHSAAHFMVTLTGKFLLLHTLSILFLLRTCNKILPSKTHRLRRSLWDSKPSPQNSSSGVIALQSFLLIFALQCDFIESYVSQHHSRSKGF